MALRDTTPPESAGPPRRRPRLTVAAPPLPPEERARLLSGAHHDPHALLGAHPVPGGGIALRALRPYAHAVSVVIEGERTYLASEGDGLFSVLLPLDAVPVYTLFVSYEDTDHEVHDPSYGEPHTHHHHPPTAAGRHDHAPHLDSPVDRP